MAPLLRLMATLSPLLTKSFALRAAFYNATSCGVDHGLNDGPLGFVELDTGGDDASEDVAVCHNIASKPVDDSSSYRDGQYCRYYDGTTMKDCETWDRDPFLAESFRISWDVTPSDGSVDCHVFEVPDCAGGFDVNDPEAYRPEYGSVMLVQLGAEYRKFESGEIPEHMSTSDCSPGVNEWQGSFASFKCFHNGS